MHQQFVQQLDEAVSEVFALMLNRECHPGHCTLAPPAQPIAAPRLQAGFVSVDAPGGVSALISFSGSMRGSCSVHLALSAAAVLTGELLGEPSSETSPLTADTTGELCNMIAGSWKSRQRDHIAASSLSSPVVCIQQLACAAAPTQAFRNSVVRTYRFQQHCLRLELSFD